MSGPRTRGSHPKPLVLLLFNVMIGCTSSCGGCVSTTPPPRPPAAGAAVNGWIDRIEGDVAVVIEAAEGGEYRVHDIPVAELPAGAAEGDVLRNGRLDPTARRRLSRRVRELQRALFGADDDSAESPGHTAGPTAAPDGPY